MAVFQIYGSLLRSGFVLYSSQELLSSTGSVWAACERLEAAPKDNKEAVLAEIQAEMDLVKDALEELAEVQYFCLKKNCRVILKSVAFLTSSQSCEIYTLNDSVPCHWSVYVEKDECAWKCLFFS